MITKSVVAFEDMKRKSICLVHVKEVDLTLLGLCGGSQHTRNHLRYNLGWKHLVFWQGTLRIPTESKQHIGQGWEKLNLI